MSTPMSTPHVRLATANGGLGVQGKSWARFVSKSPSFLEWAVAAEQFTHPNVANGGGGANILLRSSRRRF